MFYSAKGRRGTTIWKWLKRAPQQRGSVHYEKPQRSNSNSAETRIPGNMGEIGSNKRSDSISWRKEGPFLLRDADQKDEDREVNSPCENKRDSVNRTESRDKMMIPDEKLMEKKNEMEPIYTEVEENLQSSQLEKKEVRMDESTGPESYLDSPENVVEKQNKPDMEMSKKERKQAVFKRKARKSSMSKTGNTGESTAIVGIKRTNVPDDMEVDTVATTTTKKFKKDDKQENTSHMNAGLSEQPCEDQ